MNLSKESERMKMLSLNKSGTEFKPFLSPFTVTAFAIGTSLGWGSLVVTSNTYLKNAGPLGSALGLFVGMVVMLLVCVNYHYIANKYPDGTGVYSYTKSIFGYDRAFLVSWFVFLLYISIFWANATAVPLFVRYIFGDFFRFGYMYSLFGYDIYFGEILLTVAAIGLTVLVMVNSKRVLASVMTILVLVFIAGITICFTVSAVKYFSGDGGFDIRFIPDSKPISQITKIAFISPWAFVGFESVTHSSKEFNFKKSKLFRILAISVIVSTALYIFVILLSVTAHPARYTNWLEYINDLGNLSGIEALPAFYAAGHYLGNTGIILLFVSLFALVVTSLIANTWALSRLMHNVGEDSIIPERYAALNKKGIPSRAVFVIALMSLIIPFVGRSAVGWIVDVTTMIATLLYGFVSAATMKSARQNKDKKYYISGLIVVVVMIVFGAALILPGLNSGDLAPETHLLFIVWSLFGMIVFHRIIAKDHARHFGKAIIVWIALISMVLFLGTVWMNEIKDVATQKMVTAMDEYTEGTASPEILAMSESEYFSVLTEEFNKTGLISVYVFLGIFAIATGGFVSNYFSMKKYETLLEKDVDTQAQHIIKLQNDLVIGMATMVESRDNSTGGHIKRTSDVVKILVDEMRQDKDLDLDEEFCGIMINAAPMHDLGKIAVDDSILRKPGRFTPEEYEIMKTHAKEGAQIVEEILKNSNDEKFRRVAKNMAHYHHEKYDGSGYPDGLKGDEIPLEARVMAIADVYDALVSKRAYKDSMSFEKANTIILEGMGSHFDKKLEPYYIKARPKLEEYYSSIPS